MRANRVLATLLTFFCLTCAAFGQRFFVLSWAEGDLNSDGVPERVFVVSPQSPDPTNARSEKLLVVMEYRKKVYRKAFSVPIRSGFFCKSSTDRLASPHADFWGVRYLPPTEGKPARMKVTFTPGSGDFFTVVHDGTKYRTEDSGD